jgi:hypothetical protein
VTSPTPIPLAQRIAGAGLDWIVPDWPVPPGVNALVTTRSGGVSTGARATLNLGAGIGDTDAAVAENRRRLLAFCPAPPRWMHQVHGTDVAIHTAQRETTPAVADAAITCEPAVVCAVLTADCLPVVFADRRGAAVGVAHAGWRGLAAGVLERTVAQLDAAGARAGDLVAWLGPAIGPAAFEVGGDVLDAFRAVDPHAQDHFVQTSPGKWHADLYGLARRRLGLAGVSSVHGGGYCTYTESERFFSYRRERDSGRMATAIWLAP